MSKGTLTKRDVQHAIRGHDVETQKRMVCAMVGHSRIQDLCFGYYSCARCGAQLGDSLGSVYPDAERAVVVGHNCETCHVNFAACTWRDTLLTPHPFETPEVTRA